MLKNLTIMIGALLLAAAVLLLSLSPDRLSMVILAVMTIILALGFAMGIVPTIRFSSGFRRALKSIQDASKVQAADASLVVLREGELFRQHQLDESFQAYKEVVQQQIQSGEVLRDISEFISEDYLSIHSWQGLMVQIPGILTGLGILGTFIGLLEGIGTLAFSSVESAINSVALLISGIETAFYTSISGVILSILFNILYRILWNNLMRDYGIFLDCYHKQVVPPTEVQVRRELHSGLRELFRRMDQLPQTPGFAPLRAGGELGLSDGSEQLLMPQVVQAMAQGQFLFYLQPIVTLKTRKLVGAEALVRWEHPSLGLLTPAAFLPILERNAYITKLDAAIWDMVCKTLRDWLDKGYRPLPVTLNLSRADLLALELPEVFGSLLRKYRLPPRMLELELAASAYMEDAAVVPPVLSALRAMGLKVTLDHFGGDYLALRDMSRIEADALKLDLRCLEEPEGDDLLSDCFSQARALGIELTVSGIESAAQLAALEALGCTTGQGFYFYHPMPVADYSALSGY